MRARVLAFDRNLLYVQRRRELIALDVENHNHVIKRINLESSSYLEHTKLGSRLLRLGVHALCGAENKAILFVVKGRICRYDQSNDNVTNVFSIPRGSRPLFLCRTGNGAFYFGEYFSNQDRRAVHVYSSPDGLQQFDIAYSFPSGTVRHVHGIFADPYSDLLWVTTGDTDEESAIWITDDHFNHLEKVVGGSQQYRVIQLLFTNDFIYFGSDTFVERNYLYRLERKSGVVERLQEVDSSVFYGSKVRDYLFFSTAVEPSSVNKTRHACIWGSKDGESWKCVASFRKDLWPMKLFQYGKILFPPGDNPTDYLWFTPSATEKDQTLQTLEVASFFD